SENIGAPEALSEDSIKAKLDEKAGAEKIVKFPKNNRRFFKTALSIAAAIALVVVSLTAVNHYNNGKITDENNNPSSVQSGEKSDDLIYFKSYDEIEKLMKERLPEDKEGITRFFKNDTAKSGDFAYETATDSAAVGAAPSSHSETYKQLDSVDEADIVKTDGEYIYYKTETQGKDYSRVSLISIAKAENGKTVEFSGAKLKDSKYPNEFFIKDDNLIVVSTEEDFNKKGGYSSRTYIDVFDISDKSNPKSKYDYSQSGHYISSRMIGDYVYLISNTASYFYYKNESNIPRCTGEDGKFSELPVEDICAVKECSEGNYTVVGALDTTEGIKAKKTKAVIGCANNVFCSEDNLYIAGANYSNAFYYNGVYSPESTVIKYSLDKTNIKLEATCRVKGNINNQFSMDEKDGCFRLATTTVSKEGKDINVLYVFDKKLKELGRVKGFAKNEHIEAVRFIGDTAYVITYEKTDPLFIIDLSNPKKPEILGEVKISGFSTLLHPIDEKTLLGIGYATEEIEDDEFSEAVDGLKLALFDISNPAKPKVIDEKELNSIDSEVQYNHKALMQNKEKGYFAIPANFWEEEANGCGALVFSAEKGKINIDKRYASDKLEQCDRCVYIGNYIYVVDTFEGIIESFEF
ncbi:MAG: beta-propeller domain-containing protein, partial [Eubacterium sp.]|nr:beta-propeller domain-containing protein [Eubacterium sp.]